MMTMTWRGFIIESRTDVDFILDLVDASLGAGDWSIKDWQPIRSLQRVFIQAKANWNWYQLDLARIHHRIKNRRLFHFGSAWRTVEGSPLVHKRLDNQSGVLEANKQRKRHETGAGFREFQSVSQDSLNSRTELFFFDTFFGYSSWFNKPRKRHLLRAGFREFHRVLQNSLNCRTQLLATSAANWTSVPATRWRGET